MWYWWVSGIVVWLASAACIIGTLVETRTKPSGWGTWDFWGAVGFHGATAILALWLISKAMLG